jgi:hypothetical protein
MPEGLSSNEEGAGAIIDFILDCLIVNIERRYARQRG